MTNKFLRIPLILTLLAAMSTVTKAYDCEVNGIYYNLSGSEATVTYERLFSPSYSYNIVVPQTITYNSREYKVTEIDNYAFYECRALYSVTIPNSVTTIGNSAFKNCTWLTSITIPNSVKVVGNYAFAYCTKITSITIPNSVTVIGGGTFAGCTGLKSVTVGNSVKEIGLGAFADCTNLTKAEFASIEDLCKINFANSEANPLYYTHYPFINGKKVTNLVIPNTVKSIGHYAFSGCTDLTSVTIPNSVTTIGEGAFIDCTGLTSFTIPNSVTTIGRVAFFNTGWYNFQPSGMVYIGSFAYRYKGTMPENAKINIIEGTLGIADGAFLQCKNLLHVTIPNSVMRIGDEAFSGCISLASITIPNSVTHISSHAFKGCNGLTKVTLNSNNIVSSAYGSSYYNLMTLFGNQVQEYVIGDSVTHIGSWAFASCKVKSITIPNSVTSIGKYAFAHSTGLTSITIPNSVTSIGEYAFYGCTGLTEAGFESIECLCQINFSDMFSTPLYYANHLFINGKEITDLVIPNSVTSIGKYAFYGYGGIVTVISLITEPFATNAYGFYKQATLYVPKGTKAAYENTDGWKNFHKIVEFDVEEERNGMWLPPLQEETSVMASLKKCNNLSDVLVGYTYTNLDAENGDGYDAEEEVMVIQTATGNEDVDQVVDLLVGEEQLAELYKGLIVKVPAGSGTLRINAATSGNYQLAVKVGKDDAQLFSLPEQDEVNVEYKVGTPTYVYIYAVNGDVSAKGLTATTDDGGAGCLKISNIEWELGELTGIETIEHSPLNIENSSLQRMTQGVYDLQGRKVVNSGEWSVKSGELAGAAESNHNSTLSTLHFQLKPGLYIVNGRKVVVK